MTDSYKIIEASSLYQLSSLVNAEMRRGWTPLGSPFYQKAGYISNDYFQAMVKLSS